MPVDTSMYNQPANPLGAVNSAVGVANLLAQNRMLQTEGNMLSGQYQGNVAAGQAIQGAYDPVSGQFSAPNASAALAANPDAAYNAVQNAQAIASLGTTNIANAQAKSSQLNNFIASRITPMLSQDSPPTRRQIMGEVANANFAGLLDAKDVAGIQADLPVDPKGIVSWIQNKAIATLPPAEQNATGDVGYNPATNQPLTGSRARQLRILTNRNGQGGSPATQGVGLAPSPTSTALMTANTAQLANDQADAAAKMGNLRNLDTALQLARQLGSSSFGPGSAQLNQAKAFLETAGFPPTSDTDVRQELNKYLKKYAGAAVSAGRSDAGLAQALQSNPNVDLTQGANLGLIVNQIGMDRMDAAVPDLYGNDPRNYQANKSQFLANQDPRAWAFDQMLPEDRQKLVDSLGPKTGAPYIKFRNSLQAALDAKKVQAPQGATSGAQ